jgi:hypothetical protein
MRGSNQPSGPTGVYGPRARDSRNVPESKFLVVMDSILRVIVFLCGMRF